MDANGEIGEPITEIGQPVTNELGYVIYTPEPSQCGLSFDSFSYFVSDASFASSLSYVSIDIFCTPGIF